MENQLLVFLCQSAIQAETLKLHNVKRHQGSAGAWMLKGMRFQEPVLEDGPFVGLQVSFSLCATRVL